MSPGLAEEVGKTVRSAINALNSAPVVLAILIFNLMFLGLLGYNTQQNGARWERLMLVVLNRCDLANNQ